MELGIDLEEREEATIATGLSENARENNGISRQSETDGDKEGEGIVGDFDILGKRKGELNLDLNLQPDEGGIVGIGDSFNLDLSDEVSDNQAGKKRSVESSDARGCEGSFLFGVDLREMETVPDHERGSSSSKRRRYSIEESKAKLDDSQSLMSINDVGSTDLDLQLALQIDLVGEEFARDNTFRISSPIPGEVKERNFIEILDSSEEEEKRERERKRAQALSSAMRKTSLRREETRRQHEIARRFAQRFAHFDREEQDSSGFSKKEKGTTSSKVEDPEDMQGPFSLAMENIKKRNSGSNARRKPLNGASIHEFKWVPSNNKASNILNRSVPSLLDLSMSVLAKHAAAMVSLEHVPDTLRHKLSRLLCDSRTMHAHFLELLARGSPTEIRVKDCTCLTEEEFTKVFGTCDTRNLIVLQLDHCGKCISDTKLRDTLACSSCCLPALATISLVGAYRLTDAGLTALFASAPALQSINLRSCSLLTASAINALTSNYESTLRELYLDDCQNIDAGHILPALKKLKALEVLSVAGIETVCDDFVIGMVEACGVNMKELSFANCRALTDNSLENVGKYCHRLCALDLSHLHNLTDSAIKYIANGCQSIHVLKLCHNSFSDEAIAALLEVLGDSLNELSLNKISRIGDATALSLAKCSRNLCSLDLSWCRNLTEVAVRLIVDSCLSLRLLKLFGCSQITNVFWNGHSNPIVKIVGMKMTPMLEHINDPEPQEAPLRYSPTTIYA